MTEQGLTGTEEQGATQPPALLSPEEPKKTIKELAATHTELALQALVDVLNNTKATPIAKIAAANSLLDRGHGKATQYVEQTTKVVTYQDLLSDIHAKEQAYIKVVEAQEVKRLETESPIPLLTWDDVI